jgi:predicted nucleic acid-binding protein
LELLKRALLEGVIVLREVPNRRLYPEARRLSQHHTIKAGYGAVDILHVAAAKDMGATALLSFDERQKQLAKAEGFKVAP